jgi:hypothetical protein
MTHRNSIQSFTVLVAAVCVFCVGCGDLRDEVSILLSKGKYERWLHAQKPFLTNILPAILYGYHFAAFDDGSTIRPIVDYYIKAGDWSGLINITFVIEIDAHGNATGFREQRLTFIALPARETVMAEGGRPRTIYYGLKLNPTEMEAVVGRAVRRDDFNDFRAKAAANNVIVVTRFEDTDDWKGLSSK